MLKEKLLETDYFENNEYFIKYVNLIEQNISNKQIKYKTQKHHIIPRHYYTQQSKLIDNTSNNVVNLSISDHMLAHMYLSGCSKGKNRYWNIYAVFYMSGKHLHDFEEMKSHFDDYEKLCTEAITSEYNHRKGSQITEETRTKMILAAQQRIEKYGAVNKGTIWVHNDNYECMIKPSELEEYMENNFIPGRLYKHTQETKRLIGYKSSLWKRDENFCKKMSVIASNQIHTEEQNKNHSEWCKEHFVGENNPFYGKHHSETSKELNRQKHLGKIIVSKNGVVKMIEKNELAQYESLGYKRGRKN